MPHDDWAPLFDDLAARDAAASAMGGPDRLLQLAARGRLDVRTHIGLLVDPGSFVEYGALVGSVPRGALPPAPADAFVMGHATIGDRPVLDAARYDDHFALAQLFRPIAKLHPETTAHHEEQLVLVRVMVPHERSAELH